MPVSAVDQYCVDFHSVLVKIAVMLLYVGLAVLLP